MNELTEAEERRLEDQIAEDAAREAAMRAVCVVCQSSWVDVMNGEDTCNDCLRRI